MKRRPLFTKVIALLLFVVFYAGGQEIIASEQRLVHGAGTLPDSISSYSVNLGLQLPLPVFYSVRYDRGVGNRTQIGMSAWLFPPSFSAAELHVTFNALKSDRDSDFLSLYLNPSIGDWGLLYYSDLSDINHSYLGLASGVAYEHRFGKRRRVGLYAKLGISGTRESRNGYEEESFSELLYDGRVGIQALLGKRFSLAVEPELLLKFTPDLWLFPLGKIALTWAS